MKMIIFRSLQQGEEKEKRSQNHKYTKQYFDPKQIVIRY